MTEQHKQQLHFLRRKAYNLRVASLCMTSVAGSGHPTSCLSAADISFWSASAMRTCPKSESN